MAGTVVATRAWLSSLSHSFATTESGRSPGSSATHREPAPSQRPGVLQRHNHYLTRLPWQFKGAGTRSVFRSHYRRLRDVARRRRLRVRSGEHIRPALLIQKAADAGIVAGLGYRVDAGPGATAADVNAKALQIVRLNMLLIYDDTYLSNYVTFAVNTFRLGRAPRIPSALPSRITRSGSFSSTNCRWVRSLGFQQFTAQATGHLSPARVAMLLDLSGSMCCNAAGQGTAWPRAGRDAPSPEIGSRIGSRTPRSHF